MKAALTAGLDQWRTLSGLSGTWCRQAWISVRGFLASALMFDGMDGITADGWVVKSCWRRKCFGSNIISMANEFVQIFICPSSWSRPRISANVEGTLSRAAAANSCTGVRR